MREGEREETQSHTKKKAIFIVTVVLKYWYRCIVEKLNELLALEIMPALGISCVQRFQDGV